jgi:hypothetical protein
MSESLDIGLRFAALFLVVFGIPGYFVVRHNRRQKAKRKQALSDHPEVVSRIAREVGAQLLTGAAVAPPVSGTDRQPFFQQTRPGFRTNVRMRREPSHDYELRFRRGQHQFRVVESSMEYLTSERNPENHTWWEYRIEVPTGLRSALKVVPASAQPSRVPAIMDAYVGKSGHALGTEARDRPTGPGNSGRPWQEFAMPAAYADTLTCFTDDPAFAARVLNEANLALLAQNVETLDFVLTLSGGYAYGAVMHGLDGMEHGAVRVDQGGAQSLLQRVDLLAGFLDRIPQDVWRTAARR